MKKELQLWLGKVDALSVRERGIVLVTALALVYTAWDYLLFAPLQQRAAAAQAQIQEVNGRIAELAVQSSQIMARTGLDPDRQNREQSQRLREEIARVDLRLRELTVDLITPEGMAGVLEQVLTQETDLHLVRLENQGAEPLLKEPPAAPADPGGKPQGADSGAAGPAHVYRHGMVIEVRGGYLSALKYLQALEALPWRFLWGRLEFKVERYPDGQGTITVHTLGLQEGWIGV